jgi:hypothetical protein
MARGIRPARDIVGKSQIGQSTNLGLANTAVRSRGHLSCSKVGMPRLNERTNGSGYYVTNAFSRNGKIRHVTYQPSIRAIDVLAKHGIRSGNEFSKELFFELLEEGELTTGGSGLGEHGDTIPAHWLQSSKRRDNRRQIPTSVAAELFNEDGTFISFGRFKLQYGGPDGFSDDILRTAYNTLHKEYQAKLPQQLNEILTHHNPISIKREIDRIVVEFIRR